MGSNGDVNKVIGTLLDASLSSGDAVEELVDAIRTLRGWIQIWQGDREAGLTPTASSLVLAMTVADAALAKAGAL